MILFDTRDAGLLLPARRAAARASARLRRDPAPDRPAAADPLPADHVLTRSFYLLQDFPGRWAGQPVWVDQAPPASTTASRGVIVGANEWAGAWAEDDAGEPLFAGPGR